MKTSLNSPNSPNLERELKKRCQRKASYRTLNYARSRAALSNSHSQPICAARTPKIIAYKCPFGKHYHIGHRPAVQVPRESLRLLKQPLPVGLDMGLQS